MDVFDEYISTDSMSSFVNFVKTSVADEKNISTNRSSHSLKKLRRKETTRKASNKGG